MPRVINLQAMVVDTITVNLAQPDGTVQTYTLRDDIPMAIGLEILAIIQKEQAAQGDTAAQLAIAETDVVHVLGEIFRHSEPDVTDEQIRAQIAPKDRVEVTKVFFTSLMAKFKGSQPPTEETPATAPAESSPTSPDEISSPNA